MITFSLPIIQLYGECDSFTEGEVLSPKHSYYNNGQFEKVLYISSPLYPVFTLA